jgi:hypothetical protein
MKLFGIAKSTFFFYRKKCKQKKYCGAIKNNRVTEAVFFVFLTNCFKCHLRQKCLPKMKPFLLRRLLYFVALKNEIKNGAISVSGVSFSGTLHDTADNRSDWAEMSWKQGCQILVNFGGPLNGKC